MKYKKIAFLINSLVDGGAEKVVKTLIEKLYYENIAIELICLEKNNSYQIDKNIKITYLSNSNGNENGLLKLLKLPLLSYKLYKYIKLNKIKVVQSHIFRANYVNLISKIFYKNYNAQIVNHGVISRYKKKGILGSINLFLIKILYPYADKIISVSHYVQNDMQSIFNFTNIKEVVYNPINIKEIKLLSKQKVTDFIFDSNKKYIVIVGRLVKLKRIHDMLLALSKVNNNIELLVIGEGSEKNNLINLSKELNIIDRVHFLGWYNNPYKYISKCNILLSLSETESFGNTVIEAMASNTVVISTRSGGPNEIIKH